MANERFMRRGKSKIKFTATLTDSTSPYAATLAEINAAVALSVDAADISGLSFSNSPIDTPDLETSFTSTIPGEDTVESTSLSFYDRDQNAASNAIRTALVKGSTGYLLVFPYGQVAGRRMEIWPVQSTGDNDEWSFGNDPARYVVGFAVTAAPTKDATVPAA